MVTRFAANHHGNCPRCLCELAPRASCCDMCGWPLGRKFLKFCQRCGIQNHSLAFFCYRCGQLLEEVAEPDRILQRKQVDPFLAETSLVTVEDDTQESSFIGKQATVGKLLLAASVIFFVSLFLRLWNLSVAPDIFGDEILYLNIASNLATKGALVARVKTWFFHPPLFFVAQAALLRVLGISQVTIQNVLAARSLTAVWASLAIAVIFLLVAQVSNIKIGAVTALVLTLEPYTLKYGRIGILESMVVVLIFSSLYFFWKANQTGRTRNYVLAGIFFGLALLTKELAVFFLGFLVVWLLLTKYYLKGSVEMRKMLVSLGIALLLYLPYVAWGLWLDASAFIAAKLYQLERVLWIIRPYEGYASPQYPLFLNDLLQTAHVYVMTYMLIALSIPACIYLLLQRKRFSILLASLFISSTAFFTLIGLHNPQFIVYIIVPAVVVDCYAAQSFLIPSFSTVSYEKFKGFSGKRLRSYCIAILLLVLIAYNASVWVNIYGVGRDDAFAQSLYWIQANIPPGTKINTNSGYVLLLPDYNITTFVTRKSIVGQNIHYYVTCPRWNYGLNKALLSYIASNGHVVAVFYGSSLREVDIYYISNPA
jgi:hypothetical protein